MFPHLSNTARAVTFYLMALVMCSVLALVVPNGEAASVIVMVTPTLSVLLMQLVVTRDGWRRGGWAKLGMGRLGIRVWGIAVALPIGILLVSETIVRLTGLTTWHLPSGMDSLLRLGDLPFLLIFVLFEEIGWRGYLGPLLAADGRRAPHLRTGLLHGIWHLPLVFLATGAYLTEGSLWIVVPIFLGVTTCAGQLYGWLRAATGSVYPAWLTHAVFNFALGYAALCVSTGNPDLLAALGREAGIVTLVLMVAAALWVSTWRTTTTPANAELVSV
jgi:membrane protease YdiL (CAAX protease family)